MELEETRKLVHPTARTRLDIKPFEATRASIPRLNSCYVLPFLSEEKLAQLRTKLAVLTHGYSRTHKEELSKEEGAKELRFSSAPLHSFSVTVEQHGSGPFLLLSLATGADYDSTKITGERARKIKKKMQEQHLAVGAEAYKLAQATAGQVYFAPESDRE